MDNEVGSTDVAVAAPDGQGGRAPHIVERETVYDGWIHLDRVSLQMADGVVVERHVEDHGVSVTVLPYDPERRTALLVSMPRAPVIAAGEDDLLEAIAGKLGREHPRECAAREALEEAGVVLTQLDEQGVFWSMPTLSLERIHFFLAPYRRHDRIAEGGGVAHEAENITVHELHLVDLPAMIREGRLRDLKTIVLVQALQLQSPELFGHDNRSGGEEAA